MAFKLGQRGILERVRGGPPVVLFSGGSYSPITNMHLFIFELARNQLMFEEGRLDIIGGVMSPVHDAYAKASLNVPYPHRVVMCKAATRDSSWISVGTWEGKQDKWTRTAPVMQAYEALLNKQLEKAQLSSSSSSSSNDRVKLVLLCGADLLESFTVPNLWSEVDMDLILGHFGIAVVERVGTDLKSLIERVPLLKKHKANIFIVKQRISNNVSSTEVRLNLKSGLSVKYLIPDPVTRYIYQQRLYHCDTVPSKFLAHRIALDFSMKPEQAQASTDDKQDVLVTNSSKFVLGATAATLTAIIAAVWHSK